MQIVKKGNKYEQMGPYNKEQEMGTEVQGGMMLNEKVIEQRYLFLSLSLTYFFL